MTYEELRDKVNELRAFHLAKFVLSDQDKAKRCEAARRANIVLMAFIVFLVATTAYSHFVRGKPIDWMHDGVLTSIIFIYCLVSYISAPNTYAKTLEDAVSVSFDSLLLKRDVSEKAIAFRKISDVSICTEGLWVEHGWSYTILESKYFETYTDMLKFKDLLLEVARESKRK